MSIQRTHATDTTIGGNLMRKWHVLELCALLGFLSGCQCFSMTEHYMDGVDHIADHTPHMETLYCPGLDLTRIAYPDWCAYRWNRALLGPEKCRGSRPLPAYAHNPLFVQPWDPPTPQPIPVGAQIDPGMYPEREDLENQPQNQLEPIPDSRQLEEGDRLPGEVPLPPTLPVPPAPVPARP